MSQIITLNIDGFDQNTNSLVCNNKYVKLAGFQFRIDPAISNQQVQVKVEYIQRYPVQLVFVKVCDDLSIIHSLLKKGVVDYEREEVCQLYPKDIDALEKSQNQARIEGKGIFSLLDKHMQHKKVKVIKIINGVTFKAISNKQIMTIKLHCLSILNLEYQIYYESKEHLRKLLIQKEVDVYYYGESEKIEGYCFIGNKNIANIVLKNGMALLDGSESQYSTQYQYYADLGQQNKVGNYDRKLIDSFELNTVFDISEIYRNQQIEGIMQSITYNNMLRVYYPKFNRSINVRLNRIGFINNQRMKQLIEQNWIDIDIKVEVRELINDAADATFCGDVWNQQGCSLISQLVEQGLCYLKNVDQKEDDVRRCQDCIDNKIGIWQNNPQLKIYRDEYFYNKSIKDLDSIVEDIFVIDVINSIILIQLDKRYEEYQEMESMLAKLDKQQLESVNCLVNGQYYLFQSDKDKLFHRVQFETDYFRDMDTGEIYRFKDKPNFDKDATHLTEISYQNKTSKNYSVYKIPESFQKYYPFCIQGYFQFSDVHSYSVYQDDIYDILSDKIIELTLKAKIYVKNQQLGVRFIDNDVEEDLVKKGFSQVVKLDKLSEDDQIYSKKLWGLLENAKEKGVGLYKTEVDVNDQYDEIYEEVHQVIDWDKYDYM